MCMKSVILARISALECTRPRYHCKVLPRGSVTVQIYTANTPVMGQNVMKDKLNVSEQELVLF